MKKSLIVLPLASAFCLFAGCAAMSPPLVLDTVGPEVRDHAQLAKRGTLVVFTQIDPHPNNALEDDNPHYTDYYVWNQDGTKKVLYVINHHFPIADEQPTRVELPPGQYLVAATTDGYRHVKVPVVIVANRVTSVHLEGGLGVDKTRSASDKVYLPDGQIVGTRAPAQS